MKRLQREEMKECTVFYNRINTEKEQQEKKCELETQEVERRFEQVLEAMLKRQKKEVEKLEQYQIQQFKIRAKVLKAELVRDGSVGGGERKGRERERRLRSHIDVINVMCIAWISAICGLTLHWAWIHTGRAILGLPATCTISRLCEQCCGSHTILL